MSPVATDYVDALGYSLDDLVVHTAASGTTTTVVISALINAASGLSTGTYDNVYVYDRETNRQARVQLNGYTPSTGTLTFAPAMALAPSSGEPIQLTWLFPWSTGMPGSVTSYLVLVNGALKLIDIPVQATAAITAGADTFSLSALWARWLTEDRFGWDLPPDPITGRPRPKQKMLEPHPISGRRPVPSDVARDPKLILGGDTPMVEVHAPFATGTTGSVTFNFMRPADGWIGINGGSFSESLLGLSNPTDVAYPAVADVLHVSRWLALRTLAARGMSTSSGRVTTEMVAEAFSLARQVPGFNLKAAQQLAPGQAVA